MRTRLAGAAIVTLALAVPALASPALQQMARPGPTELIIYADSSKAVVRRQSLVRLSEGANTVGFEWGSDSVDAASIRLEATKLTSGEQGVEIGEVTRPAGAERLLQWRVTVPKNGHYALTTSFLLSGLKWSADYRLVRAAERPSATLHGWISLTNDSGVDLEHLSASLVLGRPGGGIDGVQQPVFPIPDLLELSPGGTIRTAFMRSIELTAWTIHQIDAEAAPERVRRLMEVQPPEAEMLVRRSLPSGPMAIVDGDDVVSATLEYEPGESFVIPLGDERDLLVERRLVEREKTKMEFDRLGQVSGFDTVETYRVEVRSHLREMVEVDLVETVLETWELQTDALHVLEDGQALLRMTVPGGGMSTVEFTLIKHSGTRIP